MNKIFLLSILFFIGQNYLAAQEQTITGQVTDENGIALDYVNIGIIGTTIGTVSDSLGKFNLYIKNRAAVINGTLRFSMIGYESQDFSIKDLSAEKQHRVELTASVFDLKEVVVRPERKKQKTIGKQKTSTKRYVNFSISSKKNQNLGSEIGKKFKLPSRKANYLEKLQFYVHANDFEKVKFRINIYSIKKGRPHQLLNRENIITTLHNKKKGWITVDLSSYQLAFKQNIIIGIEWIEHSRTGRRLSLPIIVPSLGATHYYKYGSQSDWKRFRMLSTAMRLTYSQ